MSAGRQYPSLRRSQSGSRNCLRRNFCDSIPRMPPELTVLRQSITREEAVTSDDTTILSIGVDGAKQQSTSRGFGKRQTETSGRLRTASSTFTVAREEIVFNWTTVTCVYRVTSLCEAEDEVCEEVSPSKCSSSVAQHRFLLQDPASLF